ncbi:MAG TPA: hypothetical protein VF712_02705 [Thermoleophilaceae bacterium]
MIDEEGGACATSGVGPGTLESGSIQTYDFSVAASAFPTESWLCVTFGPVTKRLKVPVGSPAPLPQAGSVAAWASSVVRADSDGDRCATEPGNIVPGPHPLVRNHTGVLSDSHFDETLDVYSNGTELWVCATFDDQLRGPVNFDHQEGVRVGLGPPDGSPPL